MGRCHARPGWPDLRDPCVCEQGTRLVARVAPNASLTGRHPQVLCIDPKTQETYTVGEDLSSLGRDMFNGGAVLGPGGVFYGINSFDHGKILRVDPPLLRERVSLIDAPKEGFDGWWYGSALAPDGCIYYVPAGPKAKQVLRFDPATEERKLIGPEINGGYKYLGCVRAKDGVLYGIPCRAHHVLKIDVDAKEVVTLMDGDLSEYGDNKWIGGALGSDSCIYGTPACASQRSAATSQQSTTSSATAVRRHVSETDKSAKGIRSGKALCASSVAAAISVTATSAALPSCVL